MKCKASTTLSALLFVPPGTYLISEPIVVYYHTQLVGDPISRPVLKGSRRFEGISILDTDPYIPGVEINGKGVNWYQNQVSLEHAMPWRF